MASPIQIILNPENFEEAREASGGGPRKDFFAGRDSEFKEHKASLIAQLEAIADELQKAKHTDLGYVKVSLSRKAWAKSHRPLKVLFKPERTPIVGATDLGVMLFEVRPRTLLQIARNIAEAEEGTKLRFVASLGKEIPYPSTRRSETGAIEKIEMFGEADRRDFSLEDALAWLSRPLTGGGYEVELFDTLPSRGTLDALDESHRRLFQSFAEGLTALGEGFSVTRIATRVRAQPLLSMRVSRSTSGPMLRLTPPPQSERRREVAPFDPSEERHQRLLSFLGGHPLVRRIALPGIVVRSTTQQGRLRPVGVTIPTRNARITYPKIGVIDGGLGAALSDWVIGRWNILADEDADYRHGSFIGGLAVLGRSLNGKQCCPDSDGAELVDLAIFPNERSGAFASYYPEGLPQFFDEVETAIGEVRAQHGVRIFNMSLNVQRPATLDRYDPHSARLDAIAEENDAIFFLSAGNIESRDRRPEWPSDDTQALGNLASATQDRLLTPAESTRNVGVAAVNPPGLATSIPFAPSRFSRRGPGLRAGVKPDLAHVGGSGSPSSPLDHRLFSVTPDGTVISGCGTSYATPLIAKTAAALDYAIEGEVSRETLIALLVHHAQIPEPLQSKALSSVARHLVGFGVPSSADSILESDDHSITLVFASRIRPNQQVAFRFPWPSSLVRQGGGCRGAARLTLVSTPPLDSRFGSEFVRINVNASLQQQEPDGRWKGRLEPIYLPGKDETPVIEAELIQHGLKWSPVKIFAKTMPRGVGKSSNWRLFVEYLTRSNEEMPEYGVPFTVILTISDPTGVQPVFNDLRQTLLALGVQIADIRTAARITPRV